MAGTGQDWTGSTKRKWRLSGGGGGRLCSKFPPKWSKLSAIVHLVGPKKLENNFEKKFLLKGPFLDPRKIILKNIFKNAILLFSRKQFKFYSMKLTFCIVDHCGPCMR